MPSIAQAPLSVPRINLRDFSARREEIKEQLMSAASEIGFFTLVGHEISLEEVNKAFGLAERFFDLPTEVKQKYPWSPRNQGYESNQQIRPSTGYPDPKESYQVGFQRTEEQEALWPTEEDCPGFRRETEEFMRKVQGLSVKVMELFAEGLGLPANTFTEGTVAPEGTDKADSMSTLRLLKYHDCEGKDFGEGYMRAGAHADFDVMTFLFQRKGQSGLELCPGRKISTEFGYGDTWVPVDVEEGAIVINVGDQLMRWSDDRLKSTFHRVRCPRPGDNQGARYSIGFFNQARRDTVIQGPAKAYPKITGGEFIAQAMKRNFEAAQAKAKAKAYEISQETIEANKGFEVSGTGLAPVKAAA